jgi:outer membrane protein assembly factor BamA
VQRYGEGLLPLSERFFLGGEYRGPRVFRTRSISPVGFRALDGTNDCLNHAPDPNDPEDGRFFSTLTSVGTSSTTGLPETTVTKAPLFEKCGGNKYFLAQLEYVFPVGQPLEVALFYDAGNTFLDDVGFTVHGIKMSTGIEARFYIPVFQFPLRLIYGIVIDPQAGEDRSSFQFSIGRSF